MMRGDSGASSRLTKDELDALQLLATGLSYKEIARRSRCSYSAAKNRCHRAATKLDARTTIQAVAIALDRGLIHTPDIAVSVRPVAYVVSCLPEEVRYWDLRVVYRGAGLWAVTDGHRHLNVNGEWSFEHVPESHRFEFTAAVRLARKHAPFVTVNGVTVEEALKRYHEKGKNSP